jgi:Eco29kI restriction endonuclease
VYDFQPKCKIGGRQNIMLDDVKCESLTFARDWWVFAAELALISYYEPEWNTSGFGSKTPGIGRPGTHRISRWDLMFPKRT